MVGSISPTQTENIGVKTTPLKWGSFTRSTSTTKSRIMSMAACKTMVFGKALTMQKKIAVGKQAVNILGRKSWVETECRWRLMIEILISFIPVISLGIITDWIWLRILMNPSNPNTSWGKLHCVSTGKPLLVCPRTIKTFSIWEVINSIVPLTKETTGRPFLQI